MEVFARLMVLRLSLSRVSLVVHLVSQDLSIAGKRAGLAGENGLNPAQFPVMDGLWHGDSSMLNIGECPNVVKESRLSWILEDNVPQKYYLSARACQGILTRASRRGKALPELLKNALLKMIEWWENGASASVGTQSIEQQNKTGWV